MKEPSWADNMAFLRIDTPPFKKPYEYKGQPLTQEIAEHILAGWDNTPTYLPISIWMEGVKSYHERQGGTLTTGDLQPMIRAALFSLKRRGCAVEDSQGNWKILPKCD
ncbi:hypothetical protein C6503_19555 [Candidatus Poribacteria bacterium]|nr:MAG: hypothetical protein C6503_19555 [Candidatus Poribacteria bacterium]